MGAHVPWFQRRHPVGPHAAAAPRRKSAVLNRRCVAPDRTSSRCMKRHATFGDAGLWSLVKNDGHGSTSGALHG